ncbi:hypothetical protein D3C87_571760 [compost metagenome]
MITNNSLVYRLLVLIKDHKKPSSPKSISVILKLMEKEIFKGRPNEEQLQAELQSALDSREMISHTMRQQHSEEELRACFAALLEALRAPPEEETEASDEDVEQAD